MSGVSLSYSLNDHLAREMLDRLGDFDRRAMFEEIGEHLVSSTVMRFRRGVAPDGARWAPSVRVLNNPGDKTLVDFGHLRDSITYRASGSGVEAGSNLVYAAIHQFGGETGRNHATHIDARPFLGLDGDDEKEIEAIIAAHIERATR